MKKPASLLKQIGVLALLVLLYLGREYLDNSSDTDAPRSAGTQSEQNRTDREPSSRLPDGGGDRAGAGVESDDTNLIAQSFEAGRSDVWVQASGEVARVLSDDNEGSRHQRFLVELRNGITVLIAHNIDLAPRVPLSRDDLIEFRGEYEWNDRGGVVHWTHHDPRGRKQGGWISHRRKTYD